MAVLLLQPTDFDNQSLEELQLQGLVSDTSHLNQGWRNTLFPDSTKVRSEMSAEHHITRVPAYVFDGWDIMEQQKVTRQVNGPLQDARGYPKKITLAFNAQRYGSFDNSVKRVRDLDQPLTLTYPGWESYIQAVLTWARKEVGLTKLYCITEHRPFVQNTSIVLNAIYFTVTGCP